MGVVADRHSPVPAAERPHHEQHPLWLSTVLHLGPGAVLTAFVVVTASAFGTEPLLALLVGILVVVAPLELGYLALHAKRTTGSWSPLGAVDYRARVPWKRLGLIAAGLATFRDPDGHLFEISQRTSAA